jgi:hypothetical protein
MKLKKEKEEEIENNFIFTLIDKNDFNSNFINNLDKISEKEEYSSIT